MTQHTLFMSMLALAVSSALPAVATASSELEAGLEHFEALEYDEAIPLLESALESEHLDGGDRAIAGLHLGIIHLAFGNMDRAKEKLRRAITLAPSIEPPAGSSPHVIELFAEARASLALQTAEAAPNDFTAEEDMAKQLLRHTEPHPGRGRTNLTIDLDPERRVNVQRVILRYRDAGEAFWFDEQARSVGPNTFEVELPGPSLDSPAVEYYIEALDSSGRPLAQLGSAATPLQYEAPADVTTVEEVSNEPLYSRWWFWTGTGVAVAAGVVTALLVFSSDEPACAASDDRGCLRVEFPR